MCLSYAKILVLNYFDVKSGKNVLCGDILIEFHCMLISPYLQECQMTFHREHICQKKICLS